MPTVIKKKPVAAKVEAPPANDTVQQPAAVAAPAVHTPPPVQPKAVTPSWMLSGAAKNAAYATEKAKQELAEEQKKQGWPMYRFGLQLDEVSEITFIDGALDDQGMLDARAFYEHTVQLNNKWENFPCTAHEEPCPICELGKGYQASLVSVLTVIDHKPYTIKKGPKAGTVIVDQRKLYVAKNDTIQKLRFKATNLKGLSGYRFSVARLGATAQKAARVGTDFDRLDAYPRMSPQELATKYGEHGVPADYDKEIKYLSAAKLIALGLGKSPAGPGYAGSGFNAEKMGEQL